MTIGLMCDHLEALSEFVQMVFVASFEYLESLIAISSVQKSRLNTIACICMKTQMEPLRCKHHLPLFSAGNSTDSFSSLESFMTFGHHYDFSLLGKVVKRELEFMEGTEKGSWKLSFSF